MRLSIRPLFFTHNCENAKANRYRWLLVIRIYQLPEFVIRFIKGITGLLYKPGQPPNMFRISVNRYSK